MEITKELLEQRGWKEKNLNRDFPRLRFFFTKGNYGFAFKDHNNIYPNTISLWIEDPSKVDFYEAERIMINDLPCEDIEDFDVIVKLLDKFKEDNWPLKK